MELLHGKPPLAVAVRLPDLRVEMETRLMSSARQLDIAKKNYNQFPKEPIWGWDAATQ